MAQFIVQVENISKLYQIGNVGVKSIRESFENWWRMIPGKRALNHSHRYEAHIFDESQKGDKHATFWALKDVSFEMQQGEVIGVIGRNGAGKSTLLKILSRITEPTSGRATIRGRIASLLEVGTGFHPDLTGRENVYLNGAILGMRRWEINRKFKEIVEFSEIERFIDMPVKHYSSGMYIRLAFAVAAHLNSEVLLLDEVLAVGDASFQKKCLGEMDRVSKQGRTIVFTSHNLQAIEALTQRCLLIENGKISLVAPTTMAIDSYLESLREETPDVSLWRNRTGSGEARIVKCETQSVLGENTASFRPWQPIRVIVGVNFQRPLIADIGIVIEAAREKTLFASHLSDLSKPGEWRDYQEFSITLQPNHLKHGKYFLSLAVFSLDQNFFYDVVYHFPSFLIDGNNPSEPMPRDVRSGELYFPLVWEIH